MKIITEYPVATDSPDHLFPLGTKQDNTTDHDFIAEIEAYFHFKKIKALDIGCAGGQLVVDFTARGHEAIGIEGSDYNVRVGGANWPEHHNTVLFTCDASKPYEIVDDDNERVVFDLVTAWEVIEHIHPDDLELFFTTMKNHMNGDSIFCGSVATFPEVREGHVLHQSVFSEERWMKEILPRFFSVVSNLPFQNKVRAHPYRRVMGVPSRSWKPDGFHVLLKK